MTFLLSYSDALIALSYFFIPGAIFTVVLKRGVRPFPAPAVRLSPLVTDQLPLTTGHRPQCVDGVDVRRLYRVLRAHAPRLGPVHLVQRTLATCTTACPSPRA